jgi:hypothetical protein
MESKKRGKQTFNLPRGDANQFTHVKKFIIADGHYKTVANRIAWADAFIIPEIRARASRHQKWFLDGALNDTGQNIRITELNLQFERYAIKYQITPLAVTALTKTSCAAAPPEHTMPMPIHRKPLPPQHQRQTTPNDTLKASLKVHISHIRIHPLTMKRRRTAMIAASHLMTRPTFVGFATSSVATCKNCHTAFMSNNKLHQHLRDCTTSSINAVTLEGKPAPTPLNINIECIESVADLSANPPGYTFRGWSYTMATVRIGSTTGPCHDAQTLYTICLDTGCSMTAIDRAFANTVNVAQWLTLPQSIPICGIGSAVLQSAEVVRLYIKFSARLANNPINASLLIEAHVIDNLRANMLLGTDMMTAHRIMMDLSMPSPHALIGGCGGAVVDLTVAAKNDHKQARPV